MYVMLYTRPNLAFAIGLMSRFLSNPRLPNWYAVKRIRRHIKRALRFFIYYQGNGLELYGYSDIDWAGDLD